MYPIMPVTLPSDVAEHHNGRLTPCQLTPVYFPGHGYLSLHPTAARSWNALAFIASLGVDAGGCATVLTSSSAADVYRSYEMQVAAKKAKPALTATPGKSNHGLGIAVDVARWGRLGNSKLRPLAIAGSPPAFRWLLAQAGTFGWSWERQDEPWHLRYCPGDQIPQRVLDIEALLTPKDPA